jgi:hypothetical protein
MGLAESKKAFTSVRHHDDSSSRSRPCAKAVRPIPDKTPAANPGLVGRPPLCYTESRLTALLAAAAIGAVAVPDPVQAVTASDGPNENAMSPLPWVVKIVGTKGSLGPMETCTVTHLYEHVPDRQRPGWLGVPPFDREVGPSCMSTTRSPGACGFVRWCWERSEQPRSS